ncbi:hypothetical protein SAMN06265379_10836 [Saccharicrinis carchari]|uniref:Outer membrane protein beta-barrel domain-containing protein n=1 Tax=Saccharicrinis carchari TaxID=1168039 RepID=A0A521E8T8_SACCC|nr:hypothetical protein [Saccharicrinis carchari]SMO80358.1 hypothetical protein SAMN06265379_10836 [Saccharicrinis carchari]
MKSLFKTFIAIVLFCTITEASAQISVGPGIVYGTDINNIGLSVNGKYELNSQWAAAPSFTYFFKKDYVTWSSLDLNANYQITEIDNLGGLYGVGGIGFTFWGFDGEGFGEDLGGSEWGGDYGEYDDYVGPQMSMAGSLDTNTTEIGVNLGLGVNIATSEKMAIAPEIMYTFGGVNYLRIGVKVMFGL